MDASFRMSIEVLMPAANASTGRAFAPALARRAGGAGGHARAATHRTLLCGSVVCLLLGVSTHVAQAQEVSGVVVEGQSNSRIADIAIAVTFPNGRIAGAGRTDDHGEFAIKLPKGGPYVLRALRMGYMPTELSFSVDDTTSVRVEFELNSTNAAAPYRMTPVVVRGRSVDLPTRLREVYERAQRNHADIFTREDFALTNDYRHVFLTMPSVHVNARDLLIFKTCDNVQTYINGTRLGTSGDNPMNVLKMVAPADVLLMEVYTHVAWIPVEYLNDACAVVAVWTK